MKIPAYPKYKSSGVEWLGDVPEGWITWKATHGFGVIGSGTTPKSDDTTFYGGNTLWVTTSELRENEITDTKVKVTEKALATYSTLKKYPPGSISIAMYGATIGRLGFFRKEATVNQACCVFSETEQFYSKFFFYWLWMCRPIIISLSCGGGQPNLSQDDLRQLRIPAPTISDQQKIADFLDWKTGQIDALIAKKKQLIEKLKEKRIALITHAVTKGLNPNAKMKDSGIPWLGDVPEHWDVAQLRRFITLQRGVDITKEEQNEGDIPVVSSGGISSYHSKALMKGPGVLVGRKGTAGAIHYVNSDYWPHDTTLYVKELWGNHPKFVYYLLTSMNLSSFDTGSSNPTINRNHVHPEKVVWPKLDEQSIIVNSLDASTNKIDRIIEKLKRMIGSFTEYRTALITATTTGKIDARGVKIKTSVIDNHSKIEGVLK